MSPSAPPTDPPCTDLALTCQLCPPEQILLLTVISLPKVVASQLRYYFDFDIGY